MAIAKLARYWLGNSCGWVDPVVFQVFIDTDLHLLLSLTLVSSWLVSFVIGPYSSCGVVKRVVKWKCGKENPCVHRGDHYNQIHCSQMHL